MARRTFSWKDPQFTYADALTGSRLIMLPYLLYALAARLSGLALVTLLVMIGTDLIDGRVARRLGHSRAFGGAFDSTIDFIVIYSLFTAFFLVGVLPWWKWAVIFFPALLMAATQILSLLRADEVALSTAVYGKIVGVLQFIYLPLLLARTYWLDQPWALMLDHAVFAVMAVAIMFNTVDYGRILQRLLRPAGAASAR
jgi:phosphatidylglycerophosphate synthase